MCFEKKITPFSHFVSLTFSKVDVFVGVLSGGGPDSGRLDSRLPGSFLGVAVGSFHKCYVNGLIISYNL